jgi:translation initiation factor IF-1
VVVVSNSQGDTHGQGEIEGLVIDVVRNGAFRIRRDTGSDIIATIPLGMRILGVKVLPGDRVRLKVTPSDPLHGQITYRYKQQPYA